MTGRRMVLAVAVALAAAACSGGGDGAAVGSGSGATTGPGGSTTVPAGTGPAPSPTTGPRATAPPPTAGRADPATATARLTLVAAVSRPTAMAVRTGDPALYVAEKGGRVQAVRDGRTTTVLDLSGEVSGGTEQGLLGLVFSPDGRRLYVDYTDPNGDTRVVEYAFGSGGADPGSRRELLTVEQPFANHNGGQLGFGPDGRLYIALGDGGSGNDPQGHAQNLATLLGSILRIDPTPSGGSPYTIPSDNPFVGRSGARPEIWAYGLRNPWRFSWDRATGDFWVADVGQNAVEEIDFLPAGHPGGANFGWPLLEGTRSLRGQNPPGGVLPIFEYGHDVGCSVTGGYVYRGSRVPALRGLYVYGDACSGRVWSLAQQGGRTVAQDELDLQGRPAAIAGGGFSIASFGEDADGELYLLSLGQGLFRFDPV